MLFVFQSAVAFISGMCQVTCRRSRAADGCVWVQPLRFSLIVPLCCCFCLCTANALPTTRQTLGQTVPTTRARITQVVQPAVPQVNWNPPAKIATGDILSLIELNAVSPVPGSFIYTPGTGTLLPVGTHTLYARFLPVDTRNYVSVTQSAQVEVVPPNGGTFSLMRTAAAPSVSRMPAFSESSLAVSVTPSGTSYQAVHLSCDAPTGVVCTFTPRDFRLISSPVIVQVNVHVPASWLLKAHTALNLLPLLGMAGLAGRRRIRSGAFSAVLILCFLCGMLTGCGSGERFHVTVIATSSTQVRTLTLDLRQLGIER